MVEITDKEFIQLADYIHTNYGIYLKKEKQALLTARLANVLDQYNFRNFSEYYNYVISDITGFAATTLIDKITTNFTYFMREPEHFYYLRDIVLPYMESSIKDKDLRIWSAGCSTGEEPYTISLFLEEYFKDKKTWDKKILATDISSRVLEIAKKGVYESKQIETLPPLWRMNYFQRSEDDKTILNENIRKEVIFRKLNLMSSNFNFKKKFNVIFCRNVMIYFDLKTKRELVRKFYDLTEPGGYLFIGHTESLSREDANYKYILPAVYRKI